MESRPEKENLLLHVNCYIGMNRYGERRGSGDPRLACFVVRLMAVHGFDSR